MAYITREEWGARPPSGGRNSINATPLGTSIHWNGPGCASAIRKHSQCAGFVRGIQDFHMDVRGWSDIAYTDFTCPHGDIFEGRGRNVGTAANGTTWGNQNYYAVYLMWGEGDGTPPDAMLDAAADAVAMHRTWGAGDDVTTHRALYATRCPGDEIAGMVEAGRFDGGRGGGAQDVEFDVPDIKPEPTGWEPLWEPTGKLSVKQIQRIVGATVDGLYGAGTLAKVRAYQRDELKVTADGLWGETTESVYFRHVRRAKRPRLRNLKRGSKGRRVRRLQRGLNRAFPAYSSLVVDGIFGKATGSVVREFQRRSGLAADGIVGPRTRRHLAGYGIKA